MENDRIAADAQRLYQAVRGGGTCIVALDVAYAIGGHSADAIARIYEAKKRSRSKYNGALGSLSISEEIHDLNEEDRKIARIVTQGHGYPMTVVAPVRMNHPFVTSLDPAVRDISIKNGTMSLLLNGGPLLNALAELCLADNFALVGSSANLSLEGSNFALEDIEPEILAAADEVSDHGRGKWSNDEGLSSTILALPSREVIRFGVCYEETRAALREELGVELPPRGDYIHIDQVLNPLKANRA